MTPERWQEIKRLLDEGAEVTRQQRPAWLDKACGDDRTLRRQVEAYLAHEDDLESFIADSPLRVLLEPAGEADADLGRSFGPYRTRDLLGHGGMGAVYRARRETGFEQEVALKLVKAGFETPEILRRFRAERQILARLDHPNIARLLDGGRSDDGRPYFVMELVRGAPIDRYCDEQRLPTRKRLELVLRVCDALQFAHRNLVVHRDIKPNNILVTDDGVPKLLDFGIAKLLRPELEGVMGETVGHRLMTPRYASPEQLLEQPITTATDVYSLGVVLYQLLTGRMPYGLDSGHQVAMMQAVCEEEPRPPSTVVCRSEAVGVGDDRVQLRPEAVATTRDGDPASLRRRLRGDVDAIVLKMLRKDPAERYASVEVLAADLRRHLDGLPVEACQGTVTYQVGKYVRRHRWGLTAAAIALAMILAFTGVLAHQLGRTREQRDRSDRLSSFLVELFRAAEPDTAGREPSVRELVDVGRRRLEAELEEEPEVRAELLGTLGQVYYRLGHFDAAWEAHEASIAALREGDGEDHPFIARALNDLSAVAFKRGEHEQAEELCRRSIAMRQRLGLEEELIKPRNNLAAILMLRGKLEEAEAIYRQGLAERRATLGERHPNVATSLRNLGTVLYLRGDFDAAEPLLVEALDIRLEVYDRDTPAVATAASSLGRLALARGDLDTAETLYLEALDIRRRRLDPDHLEVATLEKGLAALLLERGELDTVDVLLTRALAQLYHQRPEGDWMRADAESLYGAYLAARGRFAEAETCLVAAYQTLARVRGSDVLPTREALGRLTALREMRQRAAATAGERNGSP